MKTVRYANGKCRSETATPNAGQDDKRQRIVTALIVFFTVCCWAGAAVAQRPATDERHTPASENAPDRGFAHIYFANKAGTFLKAEERALPQAHTPENGLVIAHHPAGVELERDPSFGAGFHILGRRAHGAHPG